MKLKSILKTENVIRIREDETLSHALSTLGSSHDAAFVFSKSKKFLGVINPYHCLIQTSNPGNAKVEHCLFHPPRIYVNTPVSKIAKLMIDSKVHYLPVFDREEKFVGIVSARNILALFRNSELFNIKIQDVIDRKKGALVTIYDTDLISQAIATFKNRKVSKLVVVDRNMKLSGVLTYYDLISFLVAPRKKEGKGDRIGQRVKFHYHQVKNFAKTHVLTMRGQERMSQALGQILDKEIGSVIVVDAQNHPYAIITTKDFLNLLFKERIEKRVEIVDRNLSPKSRQIVGGFFDPLSTWVKKVPDIVSARLMVKEEKQGGVFKAVLSLVPQSGLPRVIRREGKNLIEVLKKVTNVRKK